MSYLDEIIQRAFIKAKPMLDKKSKANFRYKKRVKNRRVLYIRLKRLGRRM